LKRETVADDVNALDQAARAELRKYGLRFGAFNIFFPIMLKPAAADLAATLWLLKNGASTNVVPQLPRPGLTSVATDPTVPEALYRAHGFHVCGPRAVRLDILERLADLIRPLLAWRSSPERADTPPKGSTGDGGFKATDDMMSILGCSAGELGEVLKSLGFRLERRPIVAPPVEAPAAVAAPEANSEPQPPEEAGTAVAATTESAEAPAVEAVTSETTETAANGETAVPQSETLAAGESEPQPETFEEIWRPRRHHRREGGHREGGREGRHRRGKPRYDRGTPASTPPAEGTAPPVATSRDSGTAEVRVRGIVLTLCRPRRAEGPNGKA
jgi:ATP-dependent RNA helicase SUPV3L1/SUV3